LLFQRGEFGTRDTQLVAWALLWYAAGLVGHSVVEIVSRAFYALHDTRTPVLVGVGAMGLNVVLSLALPPLFAARGWLPHGGLALANSLATFLEMLALLLLMRRRLEGIQERRLLRGLAQAALGSAVMWAALWWWLHLLAAANVWVLGLGGILLGGGAYLLTAWTLQVPELAELTGAVKRRIKEKG
jgi:putative peptidoglycan lipid II flippase